jgi:hypothetical protein
MVLRTGFVAALAIAALSGCGNDNQIPNAAFTNEIDTFTVASLAEGPLNAPSAYSVSDNRVVRTYESINFEFAYTTGPAGEQYFVPLAALGLSPGSGVKPGLLKTTLTFDAITKAAQNGYLVNDSITVDSGEVYMVRSRPVCSNLGGVSNYGKIEILSIDPLAKTLTFRAVANQNCGYRALTLGIPKD